MALDDFNFDDRAVDAEIVEGPPESGRMERSGEHIRMYTPEDFKRGMEGARRKAARVLSLAAALPDFGDDEDDELSGLEMSGDPFDRAVA